ncbi:Fpg/Nei family DNA glycosylase [Vallicoccus soli]|uniref:Fpg/Nei family DNA glycosylase n=1 Tax=Vallicoccus soli TaxID=2339232 RepID=A0A3A3YVV0_9ACTN|nr:DNA-formamidopyrimidine glycosylase family protein [Vallicoccus soli]RJK94817.1 Fpg/Nei family DNA glycosylase [Vallicoccus soli]
MPELPEVEALVDVLAERAVGRVVARVDVAAINVLKTYDPPPTSLGGLEVTGVTRRGKFLALDVSGLWLVVHLSRAGWLQWKDALPATPPRPGKGPLALRLHLDDGSGFDLTEAGTQKRLAVYVVRGLEEVPGIARLGIDPLSEGFTVDALAGLLAGARQQVKGVLRDQAVIAGIGNAYSDEVLHVARLSPYKLAASLNTEDVRTLHAAIVDTLADAVRRSRGLATGRLKAEKKVGMRVHGRAGEPCPVCGDTVREVSFADRSLQYCPTCQTGGQVLADRRLSRLLK